MNREVIDRIRQLTLEERARLFYASPSRRLRDERLGMTFAPGDRVVDLASGEVCEVMDGKRIDVVVPAPERSDR